MSKCECCNYYQEDFKYGGYGCVLMECIKESIPPRKNHRCYRCAWGTWTGIKYKCSLPRCIPSLGNFNGAGKNVKR